LIETLRFNGFQALEHAATEPSSRRETPNAD